MDVDRNFNGDRGRVVRKHKRLNLRMSVAGMLGEDKAKPSQGDGVRVLADKLKGKLGEVAIRTPRVVASLEELVRAGLDDLPQVPAYRREQPLTEQIRLQAVKRELVFLPVGERSGFEHIVGRWLELFSQTHKCTDRAELVNPGMNRRRRHLHP